MKKKKKKEESLLEKALAAVNSFERIVAAYRAIDLERFIADHADVAQALLLCFLRKQMSYGAFLAALPDEWLEGEKLLEVAAVFHKFVDAGKPIPANPELEGKVPDAPLPTDVVGGGETDTSQHDAFPATKALRILKKVKKLPAFIEACGGRDQAREAFAAARQHYQGSMADLASGVGHAGSVLWSWFTQLKGRAKKDEDTLSRQDAVKKLKAAKTPSGLVQQCGGEAEALDFIERATKLFGSVSKLAKAIGCPPTKLYTWKHALKLGIKKGAKDKKLTAFDNDMIRAFGSIESGKKAIVAIMKEETQGGKLGLLSRVARKLQSDHKFKSITEKNASIKLRARGLHPDQLKDQLSFPADTPRPSGSQDELEKVLASAVSKKLITDDQKGKLMAVAEGLPDNLSVEGFFDAILERNGRNQQRAAEFLVEKGVIPSAGKDGANLFNLCARLNIV